MGLGAAFRFPFFEVVFLMLSTYHNHFPPAAQFSTAVIGAAAVSSSAVLTRKRLPSAVTS